MAEHLAIETLALDRQAEEEWARLRTHLELGPGPWIGFVFAPAAAIVNVLRERAEVLLRRQARALLLIRPETPEILRGLAARLVEDSQPAGCIWIDVLHEGRQWNEARDLLLVQLNEHREALLRRLTGGLIFAFSRDVKRRVREIAPDLWSVRSMVMHLDPTPAATMAVDAPSRQPRVEPAGAGDQEGRLALQEARRMLREKHYPQAVRMFNRAADTFAQIGEPAAARAAAESALEVAEEQVPAMIPAALSSLAGAELADGDPGASIDHLLRAIRDTELRGRRVAAFWYILLGRAHEAQGQPADAMAAFQQAVTAFHAQNQESAAMKALIEVGDAAWDALGRGAARPYYEQAVRALRLAADTDTSDASLPLSLAAALIKLAHLLRLEGEIDEARRLIEEALAKLERAGLAYRSIHILQSVVAHQTLGEIAFESGDWVAARAESEQALAAAASVEGIHSAMITADSHTTLAAVADAQGDHAAARVHAAAAVAAWREGIAIYGENQDALSRLSTALLRAAERADDDGQREVLIREAVELSRRLCATVGLSTRLLSSLSNALDQLQRVVSQQPNRFREAEAVRNEKAEIDRRLKELSAK